MATIDRSIEGPSLEDSKASLALGDSQDGGTSTEDAKQKASIAKSVEDAKQNSKKPPVMANQGYDLADLIPFTGPLK